MKIIEVRSLNIPDIKIIRYARFLDKRGYFTETLKLSDFNTLSELAFLKGFNFPQENESFSYKNVVRGLHIQWNPGIGKLMRVVEGRIIDVGVDMRINSPYFGKIVGYELSDNKNKDFQEAIWLPIGFAHGVYVLEETQLIYAQTEEYSPTTERSISPFAPDIDWSLFETELKSRVDEIKNNSPLISSKDRDGLTIKDWMEDTGVDQFKLESS